MISETIATGIDAERKSLQGGVGVINERHVHSCDAAPLGFDPSGANARNVWTIPMQGRPDSHFATFPDELPRRCILAGTSEHGVCGECGAPWVRVVEAAYA